MLFLIPCLVAILIWFSQVLIGYRSLASCFGKVSRWKIKGLFKSFINEDTIRYFEFRVFRMSGENFEVTDSVYQDFWENGYIIVKGLLDTEELKHLKSEVETSEAIKEHEVMRDDGEGKKIGMVLWSHPKNDITGMIAKSEKVAGTVEKLLGGEVYHYHSKLILKHPFEGGAFVWHQDYGYWYHNGCLFPDMGTVWIAIDRADRTNGCLKIIPKSHKLGRIDHIAVGDQTGADIERVKEVEKALGLKYVELDPGDALFFHCNVLHRSEQNKSANRRWAFLPCYNRASNNPVYEHHHPRYTPMTKVPNRAIKECHQPVDKENIDYWGGIQTHGMNANK